MPKSTVRIMRSWDFSHFEVSLHSEEDLDIDGVRALQQQVAFLVDEMVANYQADREHEQQVEYANRERRLEEQDQRDRDRRDFDYSDPFADEGLEEAEVEQRPGNPAGMYIAKQGDPQGGLPIKPPVIKETIHAPTPEDQKAIYEW